MLWFRYCRVNVALTGSEKVPSFGSMLNEKVAAERGTPERVMSPMNGVDPCEKESTLGRADAASVGPRPTAPPHTMARAKPATSEMAIREGILFIRPD